MNSSTSPFFSIITPIFNNSKHIERGYNLLNRQTFKNFEWILIDDGSTDYSGKMIEDLASKDVDRIRVFHKQNEGAGPTRNRGIKEAVGEYLVFFDIDDEIYPNWLEDAHKYIIEFCPQILISGYYDFLTASNEIYERRFDLKLYESNKEFKKDFIDNFSGIKFHNGFLWNKIYEREFIIKNGFKIPALRIQQDEVFNHILYPHVERVLVVPDIWYKYYVYERGNTRSHFISERIDIYKAVRDSFLNLEKLWTGPNKELYNYIYKRFYFNVFDVISFNLFHKENNLSKKEKRQYLSNILNDKDISESVRKYKASGQIPTGFFGKLYFFAVISRKPSIFIFIRNLHNFISSRLK